MHHSTLVILDHSAVWQPYFPSQAIIAADDFLQDHSNSRAHVINLCSDLDYLGAGYYVSLLAEARGQRVIPSVSTINDLRNFSHYQLLAITIDKSLVRALEKSLPEQRHSIFIAFGQTPDAAFEGFARQLFDRYPCPLLRVDFQFQGRWYIHALKPFNLSELSDSEQSFFGDALDHFSKRVWRKARARKDYRFDLAILHDPNEPIPTSNKRALQAFIRAARQHDIDAELITASDFNRLLEFDALFIRETTKINHYTYHFAKKAEANGLVVIDSPQSIVRCANKVFLHELLDKHRIATPMTELLLRNQHIDYEKLAERFGFPIVLKIPDGSFSIGVEKAEDLESLKHIANQLFEQSTIILAQEFVRTEYDWRIGVLNHRAIYACKYHMARNHWQIYNHASHTKGGKSGGFETVGVQQVPRDVIKLALQATRLIGDGLYGVDMKVTAQGPVIIEINDNPSIDAGVEDALLGDELYHVIMRDFYRRLDEK